MSIDVIRSFLSRAVLIEDDKHGPCVRVTLAHGKSSGAAARLHAWAIVEGQRSQPAAQSLAREVYDVAHDHAGAFDGVQRYALAAFYGEEVEPGRTGAFRVSVDAGRGDSSSAAEPTEEATGRGMLAQTMRHNEALTRFTLQMAETGTRSLAQQIGELRIENSELRTRLHDSMTAVEKAMSEQHRRELESRRFELRSAAQLELTKKLDLIFPVLLNRLSGVRAPAGPGGDTMRALVASISQEQLAQISQVLRPDQTVAFIDVLQNYVAPDKPDKGNGAAH